MWEGEYLPGSVDGPSKYCLNGTPAGVALLQLLGRNWVEAVPIGGVVRSEEVVNRAEHMSCHLGPLLLPALDNYYEVVKVDSNVGKCLYPRLRGEVGPSTILFAVGCWQVGGIVFWV